MDKVPVNFLHGAFFDHIRKLSLMCGGTEAQATES